MACCVLSWEDCVTKEQARRQYGLSENEARVYQLLQLHRVAGVFASEVSGKLHLHGKVARHALKRLGELGLAERLEGWQGATRDYIWRVR